MLKLFKLLPICIVFISQTGLFAQKFEIGAGIGPTFYKGDIQPTFRPFDPAGGGNLFFRYNATKSISIKANGFLGLIRGEDTKSGNPMNVARDYKFHNTIVDYNAQIEYNFLNFRTNNGSYETRWTPYLFGGLGQYQLLAGYYYSKYGENIKVKQSPNIIVPFGIGIKKILFGKLNVGVEFGTRFLWAKSGPKDNSDMFDGLGYQYITDPLNPSEKIYAPLSDYKTSGSVSDNLKLGNTLQKDKYFYLSFSISYCFYKTYCPDYRK